MRVFIGYERRVGYGRNVYGACGGAEPCDGDADGDLGERWDKVGFSNDYSDVGCATAGRSQRDDLAKGDGAGAESDAGTERGGDERRERGGCDMVGVGGNPQRTDGYDGNVYSA